MNCTATFPATRFMDNDLGEWLEPYEVTVFAEVTATENSYRFGDRMQVRAVDAAGYVETWDWRDLSSREKNTAEDMLIQDFERRKTGPELVAIRGGGA